jgi:acyl-CoA synthetase (AMP-forming)/AMP-acid ligase II
MVSAYGFASTLGDGGFQEGGEVTNLKFLSDKFEKWQIPKDSDIHIVNAIPKTSVGKFDKKVLRAQLRDS